MKDFLARLSSRKFILAVVAGLVIFLNEAYDLGLDLGAIKEMVKVVLGFILVEGVADTVRAYNSEI